MRMCLQSRDDAFWSHTRSSKCLRLILGDLGAGGYKPGSEDPVKARRPRQDSNLRHRLRRAIWFVQALLRVSFRAPESALQSSPYCAVRPVVLV
jgi:hypothetical protein